MRSMHQAPARLAMDIKGLDGDCCMVYWEIRQHLDSKD